MHNAVGSLYAAKVSDESLDQRTQEARVTILFAYWRVVLRLNRTEQMHIEFKQKLDDLMTVTGRVPDRAKLNDLVDLARQILKRKWDVTKYWPFTDAALWLKRQFNTPNPWLPTDLTAPNRSKESIK